MRYIVEHTFFPSELYKSPANMIGALAQKKGELLWKMYEVIAAGEKTENPYQPEDFQVDLYQMEKGWFMVQIIMPAPELQPQCSRVYVLFLEEFKEVHYFTVEQGVPGEYFLCRWNSQGDHENFGTVSGDEREQIERIITILA